MQGPFTSKTMWEWHQNGYLNPDVLIRNVNDINMRPLWTYGPVPPFAPVRFCHFTNSSFFYIC